jgi:hypothetical protein
MAKLGTLSHRTVTQIIRSFAFAATYVTVRYRPLSERLFTGVTALNSTSGQRENAVTYVYNSIIYVNEIQNTTASSLLDDAAARTR